MNTKVCVKCKEEKDLSEFYIKKNGRPHSYCNKCKSEVKKNWDRENTQHTIEYKERTKEHRDEMSAIYREKNKDIINKKMRDNIDKYRPARERHYKDNKGHYQEYRKQWREDNKEHYNEYFKIYYEKNPSAKVARNMRNSVNKAIIRGTKNSHLEETIGCSIYFLLTHLESLFIEGMCWGNYGFGEDKWNVHHYPPLASYKNLNDAEQLKQAFHWSHLYPVWTLDNISMNSWYEGKRHLYK